MTVRSNNDPAINHIVFEVNTPEGTETKVQPVDTRNENGIEIAWRELEKQGTAAAEVLRIYSEWEASASDLAFVKGTFKAGIDTSYSFPRPDDEDEWDAALAKAAESIEAARRGEQPTLDDDAILLLPVLRDASPDDDPETHPLFIMRHGAGLSSTLADVQRKENGNVGIHFLLRENVAQETLEGRLGTLGHNIAQHLRIEGGELENGERLISVTHELMHGSSVLTLPDFHAQASAWLECDTIFIGLINPDQLMLSNAEHAAARAEITRMVMTSNYAGPVPLTPATFELRSDGLERVETRKA